MWLSVAAVSVGAIIGANLRWLLGLWLNSSYHAIPWGTLVANLAGGWLVGLLMAFFSQSTSLAPEWRLFAVTGLCGALTTFSTFSLEMFAALQAGRWGVAAMGVAAHVIGSLAMTAAGFATFSMLRG
ncbi:fluoride efflux transporter CrcB [Marinobacter fuscus]|uniref:Fluoride-specific ion channel FluC n=1 Tax=Marinobacter fuscus TaxID=2109942 RepID=A0A2T1K511_9GAMM|nr:fluoride efflux transporter CrcB [Marinobacter fuscus]PSF05150.1 fluoride efflux transporter CrcB [Marinobacter fuscus]